jgi:superoxide dismutase, Fe-Mn family
MRLHNLTEAKTVLQQERLPYDRTALQPVMSKDTLDYHYGKLHKGYVDKFNAGEGDAGFNEAGTFLHNIFFPQLKAPASNNKPTGASLELIVSKFGNFEKFKTQFTETAMSVQGSAWVYLSKKGDIKIIPNHQTRSDIAMIIDWWEHAWALDYQADKAKYLQNMWRIINWDVVNIRLTA